MILSYPYPLFRTYGTGVKSCQIFYPCFVPDGTILFLSLMLLRPDIDPLIGIPVRPLAEIRLMGLLLCMNGCPDKPGMIAMKCRFDLRIRSEAIRVFFELPACATTYNEKAWIGKGFKVE